MTFRTSAAYLAALRQQRKKLDIQWPRPHLVNKDAVESFQRER